MAIPDKLKEEWADLLLRWTEEDVDRGDPVVAEAEVARNCAEATQVLLDLIDVMAKRRAASVRLMDAQGLSRAQIAVALNLSRQRISQILSR
jgi:DNA-directed RNA polymerase specialized sigma24 family protein